MNVVLSTGLRWLMLLGLALPLWAVEPLPISMEGASEEAQASYLEEQARESHEQKMAVGLERHQRRIQLRETVHEQMAAEAASRKRHAAGAAASLSPGLRGAMFFKSTGILIAGLIGFVVIFRLFRMRGPSIG